MHPLFLNLIKITAFGSSLISAALFLAWLADRTYRWLRCSNWWQTVGRTRIAEKLTRRAPSEFRKGTLRADL